MPVADVEVDHIDNEAVPQAVEQVTQRAANNQRVSDIVQLLRGLRAIHHHYQNHANTNRNTGKEPTLPAAAIGKETKRRAIVTRIMQIKRREQRDRIPQSKVLEDQVFAAQIDNQHDYHQPQPA